MANGDSVIQQPGFAVRTGLPKGNGDGRTISFHVGPDDPAIISFTAIAFLASNSTELSRMIESHMARIKLK